MPKSVSLDLTVDERRLKAPFRISGYVFDHSDALVVSLTDAAVTGQGEAAGVYYLGETPATMLAEVETHRSAIESGISRAKLRELLPPGGARNAVDCALWDLEAKRAGAAVWRLAGLQPPRALVTTFTVGADDPGTMAEGARRHAQARSLKLKLTGDVDLDAERVRAVRAARPNAWIGVDGNQGFSIDQLDGLIPHLVEERVSLLEQPLQRGRERDLDGFKSPIPIAADESALSLADVEGLENRFQVLNIKLDKCGGLTEALMMIDAARAIGLDVMVGCMTGTSLAMAPAFIVGQRVDFVDLDGPTFLAADREPSVVYDSGLIWCPEAVWGGPVA